MVTTLTAPNPHRRPGVILVALNEADARWWQFVTDPHQVYLTEGAGRWVDGFRPTAVHITPDAHRGDSYRRVMDVVHRQIVVMRPEQRAAIHKLPDDERTVRGE